jgi:hypothetical protein
LAVENDGVAERMSLDRVRPGKRYVDGGLVTRYFRVSRVHGRGDRAPSGGVPEKPGDAAGKTAMQLWARRRVFVFG